VGDGDIVIYCQPRFHLSWQWFLRITIYSVSLSKIRYLYNV